MWFARKKDAPRQQAEQRGEGEGAGLLVDQGGQLYRVTSVNTKQLEEDAAERQEPDSLDELFQGEYEPSVVNEVRQYERPPWDEEASSLDPVDDIEEFVRHGFSIPPERYDEVQREGLKHLNKLERLKQPLEPEEQAKVEQRIDLVKHKSLEDVKWLKHKAYYRSMQKIRAHKAAALDDRAAREAYLASKGAPLDVVPADAIDAPGPMQQQARRRGAGAASAAGPAPAAAAAGAGAAGAAGLALLPEDVSRFYQPLGATVAELIDLQRAMEPTETSEWAEGWQEMGYAQHGEVRRWVGGRVGGWGRRRALRWSLLLLLLLALSAEVSVLLISASTPASARPHPVRPPVCWPSSRLLHLHLDLALRPRTTPHTPHIAHRTPHPHLPRPALLPRRRRQLTNALNQLVDSSTPHIPPEPLPWLEGAALQQQQQQQQGEGRSEDEALRQQLAQALGEGKQLFLASTMQGETGAKYTPEFLELRRVARQVRQQQSQQRSAFVLGLVGALGAVVARHVLRALRGKPGGGSSSQAPSRSISVASTPAPTPR
jgi:hypothetical protein